MAFINTRKHIVRNGQVVRIHGRPIVGEIQEDGSWLLRYTNPFTEQVISRPYPDEPSVQAAGEQLETDYASTVQTREGAEQNFNTKWS